jgi:putative transposase
MQFPSIRRQIVRQRISRNKMNTKIIITVLFAAVCNIQSLFAACRNLKGAPDDCTIAGALLKTLPCYQCLQDRINQTLAEGLPKSLFKKPKRFAIDLVLIPYHGQHCYSKDEIYRSQPKSGTSHFHAYATVCILHRGFRYTVALTPVAKGEEMKVVVKRLLDQCKSIGLKCQLLLLDRGFYSVSVISYLKHAQVPFVMPVICRGKKETKDQPAGGTRKYRHWKKSGFDRYELTSKKDGKKTTTWFHVCVCCKNQKGKRGKYGRKSFTFAYYNVSSGRAKWFFETYRKRFGIETSYRQSNECRIRTSTRKPLLRLLYFALSMIMRNCWIGFEREYVMNGGRRKRQERETYFSFKDLLARLRNFLEKDLLDLTKISTQTLKIKQLEEIVESTVYTNY